jgi:TonB family protein
MKRIRNALSLLLLLIAELAWSQDGRIDTVYTPDHVAHTTKTPLYPGGINAFYKDVSTYFKIPKSATKDNIHGKVILGFTIDESGSITNVTIIQSLRKDVDDAAIKMTSKLKHFEPAAQDKKPVPMKLQIPIKI